MKKIAISIAAAVVLGLTASCSQERTNNQAESDNMEESQRVDHHTIQTDTTDQVTGGSENSEGGNDTGTIGSPGSGYGTGNTSGTSPAGTSSPSGDATNDTRTESGESAGETDN